MLQQTLAKTAQSVQCSLRQLESSEQRKGRRVRMSFTHGRASSYDAGQRQRFMYAPRDCKLGPHGLSTVQIFVQVSEM